MYSFRLKIPKCYNANAQNIKDCAERIARVINPGGICTLISKEKENKKWLIGIFNDWKLELVSDRIFELRYRYGGRHPDKMRALKTTLMWLLFLEDGDDKPRSRPMALNAKKW